MNVVLIGMPGSKTGGHIFLDGYLNLQRQVIAQIGDAEPAHAQDLSGHVAAVQQSPHGQRQKWLLLLCIKTAVRADEGTVRFFLKAAIADMFQVHVSLLFFVLAPRPFTRNSRKTTSINAIIPRSSRMNGKTFIISSIKGCFSLSSRQTEQNTAPASWIVAIYNSNINTLI